jgi:hypothetical protein
MIVERAKSRGVGEAREGWHSRAYIEARLTLVISVEAVVTD